MNDRRHDDPAPQPRWQQYLRDAFAGLYMIGIAIAACCIALVQWVDDELDREP